MLTNETTALLELEAQRRGLGGRVLLTTDHHYLLILDAHDLGTSRRAAERRIAGLQILMQDGFGEPERRVL